jgi:hypothetical protein
MLAGAGIEARFWTPRMEPSPRTSVRLVLLALAAALVLLPASAQAASLHVVFPQSVEVTVVQGTSTNFTMEVQAFGATQCSDTTAPVVIDTLYSVNAAGAVAAGVPADMPIQTDQTRGVSDNCDIKNPVLIPLTATVAASTPVGDYKSFIRYGKGGDGDVDLDGPTLTIHVVPPAAPVVPPALAAPVVIVLGERSAPKPVLGKSVMLTLVQGTVTYVAPGKALTTLAGSVIVPNGTKVDATDGVVKVTVVRDKSGALDSADAWAGAFNVSQGIQKDGRGLTTFQLRDSFGPAAPKKNGASAARSGSAVAAKKKKQSLWVNGTGNFKTRGKRASAIVRGTYWLTEETGAGTKVSVKRGLVAVRDLVRNRTVLVSAGHSYTATPKSRVARRVPAFTGSVK